MGFLGTPLGWVMYFIESFVNNYGISLILFVIFTKVALLPLTIKQQKSTAKTSSLTPKLKALEKKCGTDKKKYQEEMMKLYEENGVNPAAGCFPMLVTFALLFGIIDVIYKPLKHLLHIPKELIEKATSVIEVSSGSEISLINIVQNVAHENHTEVIGIFGSEWVDKIAHFNMNFMGINLGEVPPFALSLLILIPILSGVTAFLMSIVSMKQQERNGQKMQGMMKYMMYLTPLMSIWFAFTLPAGVGIYWIVSNIFAITQQIVIGRIYTPAKLADLNDKNTDRNREKMRMKREKMEEYNKKLAERGLAPKKLPSGDAPKLDRESAMKEKELTKQRLAEARRKMAEKYGEEYPNE